ncbi:hypothetical protein N7530_000784 [Penicillium desertorum]|uniref:Uncharacterized protein n=1 Tax=Penicillium desertorum TaxID=1303715 RepID=A0A9W9X977_9EURO|nr:hypothetical protein N7530_000784 [Penicillium desertorum]
MPSWRTATRLTQSPRRHGLRDDRLRLLTPRKLAKSSNYTDVLQRRDQYDARLSDITRRLNDRPDDVTKRVLPHGERDLSVARGVSLQRAGRSTLALDDALDGFLPGASGRDPFDNPDDFMPKTYMKSSAGTKKPRKTTATSPDPQFRSLRNANALSNRTHTRDSRSRPSRHPPRGRPAASEGCR